MSTKGDVRSYLRPHLADVEPYKGVDTPEALAARYGFSLEEVSKLDANENPYGPSPRVYEALGGLRNLHRYPDPPARELRRRIARYVGVGEDRVVVGAGADELLELVVRLFLGPGDTAVDCPPTFSMYSAFARQNGARVVEVERGPSWELDVEGVLGAVRSGARVVFLCSPNNPTGNVPPDGELRPILETGVPVVLDEAYYEFSGVTRAGWLDAYPNLIVLRTFSKLAGLAGLRIGYMLAHPDVVAGALKIKQPYNVTVASQAAGIASLEDLPRLQENVRRLVAERDRMAGLLAEHGLLVPYPSSANFVLCEVRGADAREVQCELASRGVFVRHFSKPRLEGCLRVSAGRPEDTDRLMRALHEISPVASEVAR